MTVINVQLQVTDKVCLDFLTTAVESGSHYWLACDRIERNADSDVTKIVGCYDTEDDSEKWPDADVATIREGIRRILAGEVQVRDDIRAAIVAAVNDPNDTSWDAETADCVLQAGLLGGIVYG